MENKKSVFEVLNAIDVNEHTEKKNNLTYLSWAWAWAEVKKRYPDADYTIYENKDGLLYHTDGRTAWVKTGVTIEGLEHIEYLPVLDKSSHNSLKVSELTSWDVNKAIQRSLTKACARHGLGLYIYAGEDLPEAGDAPEAQPKKGSKKAQPRPAEPTPADDDKNDLGLVIQLVKEANTKDDLLKIWEEWPEVHDQIKPYFSERRKQLGF